MRADANDLEAFLDESLPAERMAAIEDALRHNEVLQKQVAAINGRRDAGVHSLGEIWRRHRLSCPSREQLGSFLLGVSWTSTGALTSAISADKFGLKYLGTIYGTMFTIMPIGSGIGAYLAGLLYEWRHGYELTLAKSAVAGLIAAVVVFGVREPDRLSGSRRERTPQPTLVPRLAVGERTTA